MVFSWKQTNRKKRGGCLFSIGVHVKALHYVARNTAVNSKTQELAFCPKAKVWKDWAIAEGSHTEAICRWAELYKQSKIH